MTRKCAGCPPGVDERRVRLSEGGDRGVPSLDRVKDAMEAVEGRDDGIKVDSIVGQDVSGADRLAQGREAGDGACQALPDGIVDHPVDIGSQRLD